ncbi:preprotein translocase subunit SecA [Paludibaculum fermentans]|uniref:Protein translocase subunit SecA n=1 Tax=Paludibaculum fermentans TaxID=1473598 RepID=A0A7S7NRS0_PALFE|nr:accessory Sec system translocase SecA2 [Paludibaculum fermentans]
MRAEYRRRTEPELNPERPDDLHRWIALAAVLAERELGLSLFDVQLQGCLALTNGRIAEMQTGEGKTLAAVPAISWFARQHQGVHVLTVNDYLAARDAEWMGLVYKRLGLTVGAIQQGMTSAERRAAYACDITYSTANEIGFDFLRDRLALYPKDQVHRPFAVAVIDEADSILIDEARIPLVIAGGNDDEGGVALRADQVVRHLQPYLHSTIDTGQRNVALTDAGIRAVESAFACGNLFDEKNLQLHTAIQDALHAHRLLHRDVDYVVKDGSIELVDEFKGRIAQDRRWPAGLHAAIEAKEGVSAKPQGSILGSITLQHLIALYPMVCGMTGTAATQREEFEKVYGLEVEVIPPNKPIVRTDYPDAVFPSKAAKDRALLEEISRVHATGQPVLVGTASVAESEHLSHLLAGVPHEVLNARNDRAEASIIARAGERGAVTISTNMAGRGTDIRLGDGVAALGGLYVIGTNKHESRRIDNQLRGRAGRQGDPGCARYFVSLEDDLIVKFGDVMPKFRHDPSTVQKFVEGQNLDIRQFLQKYEMPIEGQRHRLHTYRQSVLESETATASELERLVTLRVIDDLWADYLARVADFRTGVHWISWGGKDPHQEYLRTVHQWFGELEESLPAEIGARLRTAEESGGLDPNERGAVWTYTTTDQPFGTWSERVVKGLRRMFSERHGGA